MWKVYNLLWKNKISITFYRYIKFIHYKNFICFICEWSNNQRKWKNIKEYNFNVYQFKSGQYIDQNYLNRTLKNSTKLIFWKYKNQCN